MVCVYCISYAPALLTLNIPGYQRQNAELLLFLVIVVQLSDVFQYIWGKLLGKRKIAPSISPNKTWEGFIGGRRNGGGSWYRSVVDDAFFAAAGAAFSRWLRRSWDLPAG